MKYTEGHCHRTTNEVAFWSAVAELRQQRRQRFVQLDDTNSKYESQNEGYEFVLDFVFFLEVSVYLSSTKRWRCHRTPHNALLWSALAKLRQQRRQRFVTLDNTEPK